MSAFSSRHAVTTSNGVPSAPRPPCRFILARIMTGWLPSGRPASASPPSAPAQLMGRWCQERQISARGGPIMCKPGSASGGSGGTFSGLGVAFAVVGIAGIVSAASAFIGTILTAALITVFGLAAAGTVALVVILCRTRSVMIWPVRTAPPEAARRTAPAPAPLAIEAPAPVLVRIGLPVGPGDLAMVTSQPAHGPESLHRVPAPHEA